LLKSVFKWAREAGPAQPLSVGIWFDNPTLNEFQLRASDIVTFHNYKDVTSLEKQIESLKAYRRPLICTEYIARSMGSRFQTHLPVFRRERVGCINWGLVSGRTQTIYPWGSLEGSPESKVWFHDILRSDGTPFDAVEMSLIRDTINKGR
jgi:hypothetical protein